MLENTDPELLEDDLGGDDVMGLDVGEVVTLVKVAHQGALVVFSSSSSFLGSSFSFVNVRLQELEEVNQIVVGYYSRPVVEFIQLVCSSL